MNYKVLTITLNPAVDKSSTVANIKPEKKLRCTTPSYEPGGGGINTSRGLIRLGTDSVALFPSGGNSGKRLENLLLKEGVATLPVIVKGETRENFIVVDTSHNEQYRFGMPGETIATTEKDAIMDAIRHIEPFPEITVISGSLPPGIEPGFMGKLVKAVKEKKSKVIVDTSGEALQEAIKEGIYLLKPNIGELSKLSGMDEMDNEAAKRCAQKIIAEGQAEIIVVSMGPQGALLVTSNSCNHIPAPSVKKLSTVGAGDSMVAGMTAVMARGGSPIEMARMGVACGSAATMNPGTGLFNRQDAEKLYNWLSDN